MKKIISIALVLALIVSAFYTRPVSAASKKKQSPKITTTKVEVNKGYKKEKFPIIVENAYGKVSYTLADKSLSKKFKIVKSTGALTVKKATAEGKYNVKIKVTAKGDTNYKSYSKTVTVKVTVNPADKGSVWTGKTDISWFTGDKYAYDIKTADQLAGLAMIINDKKGTYGNIDGVTINLKTDIVLNDTTDWETWSAENPAEHNWTPIGRYGTVALDRGTGGCLVDFNGNGHTIRGLFYHGEDDCGVFGYAAGVVIRDLNIEKSVIVSYNQNTRKTESGALIGRAVNCYIENCHAKDIRIDGASFVGGLIGKVESGPKFMWLIATFLTSLTGLIINPLIMREAGEDGSGVHGTCISNCTIKNARLRAYKPGSAPTVGGLVGGFFSDGIIASCSTKNIKGLSIDTNNNGKHFTRPVRLDYIVEDEEAGNVHVDKGKCGAILGEWSYEVKVLECSFSKFSRLDNTDERSDSDIIY
ncbi:MAG: cadherin repeat domain-containing protein [Lachnospiraceae bacterium]|nr:cadherin repeat domain-containing protein [Lachnospiraceae bacterium]